jgi:molybdenum cofactor synthesis domain-containing protein
MSRRNKEWDSIHVTKFDLLRKTEIRIENIGLKKANLTDIAEQVAKALGLNKGEVLVVDYRDRTMILDVLNSCVNAYNIVGREDRLLEALSVLPGVLVLGDTCIRSDGMLGWMAMDEQAATEALRKSEQMAGEILVNISKRVIVFSTGAEVAENQIEDTNMPAIEVCLTEEGYKVSRGQILKDDQVLISAKLMEAADRGYGLIITTGGVGAEDKDFTVEAVKNLDPDAATPYICHFAIGTGRHVKDGIRIAVGRYGDTLIVALPGPNDEVRASLGILVQGLKAKQNKRVLAKNLANNLRDILKAKMSHHYGSSFE